MNFLFSIMVGFSSIAMGVLAFVDAWNLFILPVDFTDEMTFSEGFAIAVLSCVFFIQTYDFERKLNQMPQSNMFSRIKKELIVDTARTFCFGIFWGLIHFLHWVNS